jgi:hypothetical protein
MKTIAIMQPTYLPWAGYFGLMESVDEFIILDTVQFARRSWQQRNQIKTPQGPIWLTVPVLSKGQRDQWISDVAIDTERSFARDHIRSLEHNYRAAPYFDPYAARLFRILDYNYAKLATLTGDLIVEIRSILDITTPMKWASEFGTVGAKADLLADLAVKTGATRYISPPGSRDYLDESSAFARVGIEVGYFEYKHPIYRQLHGEFVSHMSVVDLILNTGPDSPAIMRQGIAR